MGTEANLMDDLAEAWDEHFDEEAPAEEVVAAPEPIGETEAASVEPAAEKPEAETAPEEPAAEKLEAEAAPEETAAAAAEASEVPSSLPPEAREVWKDTPKAMQAAITKREAEFQVGIQKYAENAKRAEGMDQVLAPYQQYLAMNGGPGQAISGLLQTGALLQAGSPTQKAQAAADIIKQFGIDISALDSILVGQAPPAQSQQQDQIQTALDQRLAPIQQFMQNMQRGQQQQATAQQNQVKSEVELFAADSANEFYKDVSGIMADCMDRAGKRGESMNLPEAYAEACQIDPGVRNTLQMRSNTADLAAKQAAATSISGNRGTGDTATATTLRGQLEDSWDTLGRA